MYRALFLLALLVPLSVGAAPFVGPVSQAQVEIARGSIASLASCGGGAQRFVFQSGVPMVFDPSLTITYPRGLTPQTGSDVFVVLAGNVSCGSGQGRLAIYLAPSALVGLASGVTGSGSGSGAGDSGSPDDGSSDFVSGFGSDLLNQARDFLSNLLRPPSAAQQNPTTQAVQSLAQRLATCPTIFGGRVPTVIQCNGGIVFIPALAGVPYAGPLTWVPGGVIQPYAVNMGGPPIPSQCIIGCYGTPVPCVVGTTLIGVGPQIMYYGSSPPGCTPGASAPPSAQTQQSQPQITREDCEGGNIPTKSGESVTECNPQLVESLNNFCSQFGNGFRVTEGCTTPFRSPQECRAAQATARATNSPVPFCHVNPCHYNGTCVDIGFTGQSYSTEQVKSAIDAADQSGSRVVFESDDEALIKSLHDAGVPKDQARFYPNCSTGARPCVTGSHFSYYCRTCR